MTRKGIHALGVLPLLLTFALAMAHAQALPPGALSGWSRYVQLTENRIERELSSEDRFFAYEFQPVQRVRFEHAQILSGDAVVAKMRTPGENGRDVRVTRGMVHHWRGAVFIPDVTLETVLDAARGFDEASLGQEDVLEAKILEQSNDSFRVYLKLTRSHIVTATYDTEHIVRFHQIGPERAVSRSVATRITELAHAGTDMEQEKPLEKDRGFLWRMNSYWRYLQTRKGVIVECESLTLSRSIPVLATPVIHPIIDGIAKDSMTRTLVSMRRRLQGQGL